MRSEDGDKEVARYGCWGWDADRRLGIGLGSRCPGLKGPSDGARGPGTGSRARLCPSWHVTCFSGNSMNSSVLATSTKCCSTYLCAALSRSLHECVSAKPRMPRQLEGSS